ncbi:MAG: cupin domain-containing protein [Hyphomicrobium sp.]|nr:cupin domain-containing protein [Hyphomicrobium sp.]
MPVITRAVDRPGRRTTIYPAEFAKGLEGRLKRALTEGLGLTQFGVNLTTLDPGGRSSQRHWHEREDECIFVLDGELVLVTEAGETVLRAGDAAGFPAGDPDGHCLINRSAAAATYLEIGTRSPVERAHYPDIDLVGEKSEGTFRFFRRDGTPCE